MILVSIMVGWLIFINMSKGATLGETKTTRSYLDGNWLEVTAFGKRWVKNDPFNPVPHALMNIAYTSLQMHREVKTELKLAYNSEVKIKKVLKWASALANANPNNPRAHLLKGLVLEVAGENQGAIYSYNRGIAADPTFSQNYTCLGNLYFFLHKPEEALKAYMPLLKLPGCQGAAYNHIATIWLMKKDEQKALEYFEKSVEVEPNDLVGLYNLASIYEQTGQIEKSTRVLVKISAMDPDGDVGDDARAKLAKR